MTKKFAVVTGASGGIGGAVVRLLHEAEYTVETPARRFLDLQYPEQARSFGAMMARKHPVVSALVLCAGEWFSAPLTAHSWKHYHKQYTVNVVSNFELIRGLAESLRNAGGSVVLVASTRGLIGGVESAPLS